MCVETYVRLCIRVQTHTYKHTHTQTQNTYLYTQEKNKRKFSQTIKSNGTSPDSKLESNKIKTTYENDLNHKKNKQNITLLFKSADEDLKSEKRVEPKYLK